MRIGQNPQGALQVRGADRGQVHGDPAAVGAQADGRGGVAAVRGRHAGHHVGVELLLVPGLPQRDQRDGPDELLLDLTEGLLLRGPPGSCRRGSAQLPSRGSPCRSPGPGRPSPRGCPPSAPGARAGSGCVLALSFRPAVAACDPASSSHETASARRGGWRSFPACCPGASIRHWGPVLLLNPHPAGARAGLRANARRRRLRGRCRAAAGYRECRRERAQ